MNVPAPVSPMITLMLYGASAPNVARGTARTNAANAAAVANEANLFMRRLSLGRSDRAADRLDRSAELADGDEDRLVRIPAHDDDVFYRQSVRVEIFEVIDAADPAVTLQVPDPVLDLCGGRIRP